jgi:hypothetical protein
MLYICSSLLLQEWQILELMLYLWSLLSQLMCQKETLHVCTLNCNTFPKVILATMNSIRWKGKQVGMASIDIIHMRSFRGWKYLMF